MGGGDTGKKERLSVNAGMGVVVRIEGDGKLQEERF